MAEQPNSKPSNNDASQEEERNPIISFLVNIFQLLPFPKNHLKKPEVATELGKPVIEEPKPTFVTFPKKDHDFPSLKLEAEGGDTNTNPLLLYQVYAIGGFFVLRWAWCRWNELRGRRGPSNEEPPSNEDPAPPRS